MSDNDYKIGDMIIIPYVEKIGIIVGIKGKTRKIKGKTRKEYEIFWTYKTGFSHIDVVSESTINLWLSKKEGKAQENLNQYIPVPK